MAISLELALKLLRACLELTWTIRGELSFVGKVFHLAKPPARLKTWPTPKIKMLCSGFTNMSGRTYEQIWNIPFSSLSGLVHCEIGGIGGGTGSHQQRSF